MSLSDLEREELDHNGYVVLPGFVGPARIASIQARIEELLGSRVISNQDRKEIDIFSAQYAFLDNFKAISQLTQRVLALESSLEKLAAP